jgi:hypothetical protein
MMAPMQVVALDIVKWGKECKFWLQCRINRVGAKEDPMHKHGIKRHNIVFKLPYWEVSSLGQNIES